MNLPAELREFTSDGCTGFVQFWRNVSLYPCCYEHDITWYLNPGNWLVWFKSNIRLGQCFAEIQVPELSVPAIALTMTIGAILFATAKQRKAK